MPDIKISDLTAAASASGSMQLEVNDSGTSKRITVDQIKDFALPDGAVTTAKLADASVTAIKLANSAVDLASAKVTGVLGVSNGGTGSSTADGAKVALNVITGLTGSLRIPAGTTAQRDGSPSVGFLRYNSTLGQFEGFGASGWGAIGGGSGGAVNDIFYENSKTLSSSYSITSGKNAMTTGDITIASGVTVTVPSGSRWVIL